MLDAHEVYTETVRRLPPSERLRLAAMILDELAQTASPTPKACEPWSEVDLNDLTDYSLGHAVTAYPEDDELA